MSKRAVLMAAAATFLLATQRAYTAAPSAPVIDKVVPLAPDPLKKAPGVFYFDDLETESDLRKNYHDTGLKSGRFTVNAKDAFSGSKGLEMAYISIEDMKKAGHKDPGSAGWIWRFFGDNPKTSRIPASERKKHKVAVARWYHKFPEGFKPRGGTHYPPKMARMRVFTRGAWGGAYTYLYWIGGKDGHLSLERHTRSPKAHREWLPNYTTNFKFSNPVNQGRWIHFEMRIEIGDKGRSDNWQAWADGILIGEAGNDDMSGGWQDFCLNGMSWDTYWNGGSPVAQSRFYDDLSLSTKPMGPARTPLNPVIQTGAFRDSDEGDALKQWQVEVGTAKQKPLVVTKRYSSIPSGCKPYEFDRETVWAGGASAEKDSLTVDAATGAFKGPLEGKQRLDPNTFYMCRIRHQDKGGEWSEWSAWHAAFATVWPEDTADDAKTPPKGYYLGQTMPAEK